MNGIVGDQRPTVLIFGWHHRPTPPHWRGKHDNDNRHHNTYNYNYNYSTFPARLLYCTESQPAAGIVIQYSTVHTYLTQHNDTLHIISHVYVYLNAYL